MKYFQERDTISHQLIIRPRRKYGDWRHGKRAVACERLEVQGERFLAELSGSGSVLGGTR